MTRSTTGRLQTLEVVLTSQCNLRCGYCYQNNKGPGTLSWENLEKGLALLLSSQEANVTVVFLGGEPLLELELIQRAVQYTRQHRRESQRVGFAISTNGMLLEEKLVDFLAAHSFETFLSFDGVPAAQAFRGLGTHAKLDKLLDVLRAKKPDFVEQMLTISITVHSGNLHLLADSVAYFLDKGIRSIGAGPLFTHDSAWHPAMIEELDRQLARVFETSVERFRRDGAIAFHPFRAKGPARTSDHMCGVGTGRAMAIDVNGELTGCVTFSTSYQSHPKELAERLASASLGTIGAPGLKRRLAQFPGAIQAAGIFSNRLGKRSSYRACKDCDVAGECSVCPVSLGQAPGKMDVDRIPDNACAWNLVVAKYRSMFPRARGLDDLFSRTDELRRLLNADELQSLPRPIHRKKPTERRSQG